MYIYIYRFIYIYIYLISIYIYIYDVNETCKYSTLAGNSLRCLRCNHFWSRNMPTFTTLRLLHVSTLEPSAAALHGDRAGGHKMRCIRAVQRDERHGSHGGMEALGWEQ